MMADVMERSRNALPMQLYLDEEERNGQILRGGNTRRKIGELNAFVKLILMGAAVKKEKSKDWV